MTKVTAVAGPSAGGCAATRLRPVEWLICGIAALGFASDLYEVVVLPLVLRPAPASLGSLVPGYPAFDRWVGWLFYVPALIGGAFGLLGGCLTDRLGRRLVLVWSLAALVPGAGGAHRLAYAAATVSVGVYAISSERSSPERGFPHALRFTGRSRMTSTPSATYGNGN
jgi:MFS family permease